MSELKACPFCGGPAVVDKDSVEYGVSCVNATKDNDSECPIYETYTYTTEIEAIKSWNRRLTP